MKPGNSINGVLAGILLLVFCNKGFGTETYFIRNYSDLDGLSMNIGVSIVQDDKGYIWIATQEGLNRFDGQLFEIYTKKHGLPCNFINTLYIHNKVNFWVGTRKGLCLYRDNRFIAYLYKTNPADAFKNNITCITEMEEDKLLVGTAGGLLVLENLKDPELKDYPLEDPYLKSNINAVIVDKPNKRIYLGTTENGVLTIENNKIKPIDDNDRLTGKFILSLYLDGEDLWIGTDGGLNLYRNGKVAKTYTNATKNSKLIDNGIYFILKDDEKKFWAATSNGLYQVIDEELIEFPKSAYLGGNKILALNKDKEVGIWVGLYGGISYLARSKFRTLSMKDQLPSDSVFGIYQAKNGGNIWVATYGGIAVIDEDNLQVIKTYTTFNTPALPSNSVNTIAGDKQGNTWIATYEGGLVRYSQGHFKVFNVENGLPNNNVRVVYVDLRDNLWLGIKDAGLVLFNKKYGRVDKHFHTASNPKLLSNNIRCIYDDEKGNLWIGTEEGLCKFPGFKFDEKSLKKYLIGHFISGILKDGDGYWITTFDDGLFYLDESLPGNPKIENYSYKEGFLNNNLYGVARDKKGRLWIPNNKGIIRYDRENENKEEKVTHYTMKDGLPANENNAYGGVKDTRGRFWFSTHKGIVVMTDVDNPVYKNKIEPLVVIERFKAYIKKEGNNKGEIKDVDIKKKPIILKDHENNISIKFTALSYRYPEAMRFKTRLEGFPGKEQWEELKGKDRFVEYTNLPPGYYTFQVNACNNDGLWNEKGDLLKFTIKPSFFQTPWFYALLSLLILISFYGFYRVKTSQQLRKQERLEQKVRQRTRELEETQAQLIHQGKMASLGEMAAELAHDMNNPANYIYGNIDLLEKYIDDIKSIVWECIKLELPAEHPVNQIKKGLYIEEAVTELDGLIKYVKEGAVRISDIVNNFMAFVGKDEPGVQPIDIHENIEITLNLLQNKIKNRVEIEKIFGEIPKIEGYPGQMNQVWMNLLSNAADAIPGQGVVTIETSMKDAGHVLIRISDTGAGIAEKDRGRIFEPFFTTKTNNKGMGLGLAITKKIIEKHNGLIDFESKVGQGTSFFVILPIKQK
jgi:signal transduction histidine kinase/ligand-binding sensor domain-containing protein